MTTNRPIKPTFKLVLEALPDALDRDPTGILRLRSLLKTLLRGWRFKCTSAERVKDGQASEQEGGDER